MDPLGESIGHWLDQTSVDPAGAPLSALVRRLTSAVTVLIPPNRRSVSITVFNAPNTDSPVIGGLLRTQGDTIEYRSDYPGFQLGWIDVSLADGDDVFVVETWVTAEEPGVPPPPAAPALLLEDGSYLLLEDGSRLLLEP